MTTADDVQSAPSLEVLDEKEWHTFVEPRKMINEGHDVSTFLTSKAYGDIMTFLLQLNRAMFPSYIQNPEPDHKRLIRTWELKSSSITFSETVERLRSLLEDLNQIVDEVPPDTGPRRFGNANFRKWHEKVEERTKSLLYDRVPPTVLEFPMIPGDDISPFEEIKSYFLGSFGSAQRLDYGSGHELSFLAFLGCIWKLGGFSESNSGNEERGIVLGLIEPYLRLVRRLIRTYTLEPAGSHGVWGLDDHSFIPYIFGSAQYGPPISPNDQTPTEGSLEGAPDPADVAKKAAVERERNKNMYFGAIGFIHDMKSGPFWEHSPMLFDISGVRAGWGKINKVS
jgi:serine/threonine-protein phosphatase 2A activator